MVYVEFRVVSKDQYSIAMIAEMIHVASLLHDDVIDESDTRRGLPSANKTFGNKMVILSFLYQKILINIEDIQI